MKTILLALILAQTLHARVVWSPDKRARIEATESIDLFDENTQTMLTIIPSTTGAKRVEVAWSPDSKKVAIVENFDRGSVVFAAWFDGMSWHKAIQPDSDSIMRAIIRRLGSRVLREERSFTGWTGDDAIRVKWRLGLATGRQVDVLYKLEFVDRPTSVDRGGYEEGAIVSKDLEGTE